MPAGAWERGVLPARVNDYDPAWLDQLSFSGELVWGRLQPPRRGEDDGPSAAAITRAVPISLCLRSSLGWLLPAERPSLESFARSNAASVLEALSQRGALFQHELCAVTKLLPAQLAEALHELAALGLVTADAFGAVRAIVAPPKRGRNGWVGRAETPLRESPFRSLLQKEKQASKRTAGSTGAGRWSLFPGFVDRPPEEQRLSHWCWQLLERWGVLFRDLLARESAAPSWPQLVSVLRRMESRGEIRGGRFISGVAGEQFATGKAVELLRQIRNEPPSGQWIVISAADPLNLAGILTPGARVPGTHTNSLAVRDGHFLASQQAGEIQFAENVAPELAAELSRKLRRTG
jgi:ATP-dependent Lhr-like helicase